MNGVLYLGLFAAMFVGLERAFPARRQRVLRRHLVTDGLFYFGQYFVWTGLIVSGLVAVAGLIEHLPLSGLRAAVASQPLWLQVVEVVLLCDVCVYWGHRLSHRVDFLWRFHRVHHTTEELDWVAAWREHPVDGFYTRLIENLPALLLGFPLETIAGFVAFRGLWGLFIHSNVGLRLGPLEWLLGSPRLHHWHHDVDRGGRCNFANLSPLMDIVFGTFYDPRDRAPGRFGTSEEVPQGYLSQLLYPLLPRPMAEWWGRRGQRGGLRGNVPRPTGRIATP